jgi:alpha-ketoglutarate-dependent taurine dioxygenase
MTSPALSLTPLHPSFGLMIESRARAPLQTLPAEEVAAHFRRHGALLFRNFAVETEDFLAFTSRYCRDFSTYQGGGFRWGALDRKKINGNDTLLTVTGSTQSFGIPLHGEMYYMSRRPTLLWFYCESPPTAAGETTLCDGAELYRRLSPPAREYFLKNRLRYIRHLLDGEWQVAFQTGELDDLRRWCVENETALSEHGDGSVTVEYVSSAVCKERGAGGDIFINNLLVIHSAEQAIRAGLAAELLSLPRNACPLVVRLEDGSEIPAALVEEIEETANSISVKHAWRKGDVLLVDNTRVLHGRKKCADSARNIYVRMGEPAFAL